MTTLSTRLTAGAGLAALAGLALAPGASTAESAPRSLPGTLVPVYAGPAATTQSVVEDAQSAAKAAPTAKFVVTYTGFTAEAKAAFQRAVNTWAGKLNTTVPVTVKASWEPLGPGVLGAAGPSAVWDIGGVWNVDAIANKKAGKQLNASPDIVARFSSNFTNWWFGTGPAPVGKYDFQSVVTHELGHGVGFLGVGNASGSTGTVKYQGKNTAYDRYTRLGSTATSPLLWKMPDNSTQLGSALKSNNVFFDSPGVRTANGGKSAKLYAPSTWRQGSSYSHLDETTFPKGNQNSLMTYAISDGETIRTPGPVTLALLKTIGW